MARRISTKTSRHLISGLLASIVLAFAMVVPAEAMMACGPHAKMIKTLKGKYKEQPKGLGIVDSRKVVEVYVSKSGSWTLVMTDLNGISCIVAAGHSWEDAPKIALVEPDI